MNDALNSSYAAAFLGVLLTAVSQLLFKLGAARADRRGALAVYTDARSVCAYGLLLAVTVLNLYAYRRLPLKVSTAILPVTYLLVGLFSFVFLKERATRRQLIGAALIVAGIIIFNLG